MLKRLTQAQLKRQLEIILTNGRLSVAQEVIETVGYNVQALDEVAGLLQSWEMHHVRTKTLLLEQKRATQVEAQARDEAHRQVRQFGRTAKVLFRTDEAVLRLLGLKTPRGRNGAANGVETEVAEVEQGNGSAPARRASQATAATIDRWRQMFVVAQELAVPYQERLARTSWPTERLVEALAQVEAFAEADTRQQEAIRAYRAQIKTTKAVEAQLRDWLNEFRQLTRVAIEESDPQDRTRLRELMRM